jgi:mRNA interferase RelE/StbE
VKLTGSDDYRVRVGDYRIIYSIIDDRLIVLVIDVGHGRDVYRRR